MNRREWYALSGDEQWDFYNAAIEELQFAEKDRADAEEALGLERESQSAQKETSRAELFAWLHELHGGIERDPDLCFHSTCLRAREILGSLE
jgi:hypothetical protein